MQLNHPELLRDRAYINGQWQTADNDATFSVQNPWNGATITSVPDMGASETKAAIEAAASAFKTWRKYSAYKRGQLLRRWFELQLEHLDDLALILTTEQGKPLKEAKSEIKYGASFVEWYAEEARRAYGDVIPAESNANRITVIKQPIGVVGAITPWNFPNAMITRKVSPALAAGCTVVLKPAEDTPLSALALAQLAEEAGIPAGVLNIITTSDAAPVGEILTTSEIIRKVSFTGSTEVGKVLMKQSASTIKKVSLELGGNAPFIVFEDADVDAAVEGAMTAKYRNAGQTCICANRFYVHASIYDAFTEKLAAASRDLNVGVGTDESVDIGPLINENGRKKVERLLQDAKDKGAKVICGGTSWEDNRAVFMPTVLTDVSSDMNFRREEIFGPLAPIFKFQDEEEVIKLANDTDYGLAAYFYGNNYARIWRVADALEYGMVGINTGAISTAVAPFGGVKQSGIGREGSHYGLDEFMEIKYLNWGGVED